MKIISNLIRNPLFSGSFIMIIGSNATNFINYIYHLIMGRLLGPANYGELAVLFSLVGLLGIIPGSLSLVIIKYISSAKDNKEIEGIVGWLNKWVFLASTGVFLFIFISAPFIASFLNITNFFLVTIIGAIFFFSLPALFNRSVLQGLLRFRQMVISILVENSLKLLLGIILIFFGYSVGGATFALVVAAASGWIISRKAISDYSRIGNFKKPPLKAFFMYSIPVLIQSVAMTSLYSTDLILVKHFFPSHDAGIYASISTLGKIIFYGTGPIGAVMFPIVARRKSRGEDYKKIFNLSLLMTGLLALAALTVYYLLPEFTIKLLYGSSYLEGVNLLIWFGVFMTLFSLSWLIISYCLSIGRTKVVIFPTVAAILQIFGIWIYHSDLLIVIIISIIINSLLLILLLIYSSYENANSSQNKINFNNRPSI